MPIEFDERLPKTFALVCRSIANFGDKPRPPGDVERACQSCNAAVSLTERGQEQERDSAGGAVILCNPCALVMAARLKAGGTMLEMRHNPMAVQRLQESEAARRTHELFERLCKP